MGSKHLATEIDELLNDLRSTVEWCIDPQRLSGVYVDREKADRAVTDVGSKLLAHFRETMLRVLNGLEVDREASEKHIRNVLADDEEIEQQLLSMELDADDRHDVLEDVRKALETELGGTSDE